MATISLPAADTIKIGWVVCRLTEQMFLKRRFRCLDLSNIAKKRTDDCSRSKGCRECGGETHIFKKCKAVTT